jgi:uncharacterized protein YegL
LGIVWVIFILNVGIQVIILEYGIEHKEFIMPRITDDLEQIKLPTNQYGYSATKLNKLEASEYTLVQLIIDESGSVESYRRDMEQCVKEVIQSCQYSPRADNLMLRIVSFNTSLKEIHGFKPLSQCNLADYDNVLNPGGMTALFDATDNALGAANDYAQKLSKADFTVNGLTVIITDGEDNSSRSSRQTVKTTLEKCITNEAMESMVSILVAVGTDRPDVPIHLEAFKNEVGMTEFINVGDANKKTLAKLARFISKSISSQSSSLGSGAATSLTF